MTDGRAKPALSVGLLLLLAGVGALGSLAIHMLVPALPAIARDFAASDSAIQSALTVYLLALGGGQLVAGPAADIAGRRPLLLAGATLFTIGAAGAAVAGGVTMLVAARIVQALGGAAGIVAARAIVSDLTDPRQAAGKLAMLTTVVLISPALAPVAGGLLVSQLGWRSIFTTLAVAGLMAGLLSLVLVRESGDSSGARLSGLLPSYSRLLRNGRFRRYCVTSASASCALYIFLAGSSFLLSRRYGLSPDQAGLCYFLIAAGAIAGTFLVAPLERRRGAIRIGLASILTGGALMLLFALMRVDVLAALLAPMLLVAFGGGMVVPAAIAGAMNAETGLAGTGASLAGALQMSATGALTTVIAHLQDPSLMSMGIGICTAGLVALSLAPPGPAVRD